MNRTVLNSIYCAGAGIFLGGMLAIGLGTPPPLHPLQRAMLVIQPMTTMSDGRCTGFPNKIGQWDWSVCCVEHDFGGTDGALAGCILERTPVVATPFVFLGLALMAFGRPLYNLLQRMRIVK